MSVGRRYPRDSVSLVADATFLGGCVQAVRVNRLAGVIVSGMSEFSSAGEPLPQQVEVCGYITELGHGDGG